MLGMVLPYITSQIVGLPRAAKIIGGAYLTGALVAAIQATLEGEGLGTTVKRSALSWGSVMGYGYKGKTSNSGTKTKKTKKISKAAAMKAVMSIQERVDAASQAGNDAEVLKLHIELATLLKKHKAPKAIQNECATLIKDLQKEIRKAKRAKAPATATATATATA
jgi:hypothetical protein